MARSEPSAVKSLVWINWLVVALLIAAAGWTGWIVVQNWGGISV